MKLLTALTSAWCWRMAWRDSRASLTRLLLFSSSIILGIAALVAVNSFAHSLRGAIQEQARGLVGADLVLRCPTVFSPEAEALFEQLGGKQAREISFTSMAYFPKSKSTRLVQVRALNGDFPFYGKFETEPPAAGETFRQGQALLEDSVMVQFNVQPGDEIKIGNNTLNVAGMLKKVPGESIAFSALAPRVYVPFSELPKTELLKKESLARHKLYIQYPASTNVEKTVKSIRGKLLDLRMTSETVEDRKRDLGKSMENLYHFLSLLGFIALLLGGIGVATAIHLHVEQRLPSLAVLKCLGASQAQVAGICFAQTTVLGLGTALAGALLGVSVQLMLPQVFSEFLPFPVEFAVSWKALAQGIGFGFFICVLFSLFPLMRVRTISPLMVLRRIAEAPRFDPVRILLFLFLALTVVAFSISQTQKWRQGVAFAAGVGGAFLLLTGVAHGIYWLARKLVRPGMPYTWRQGLANLYRPQNRTLVTMTCVGLASFFILTIYLTHNSLLDQISTKETSSGRPNVVMFDIQDDQKAGVEKMLAEEGLPLSQHAPLVTMRLATLKGEPVEKIWKRKTNGVPQWALRREYRSTYRDTLADGEEIVTGTWPAKASGADVAPVSIEEGIADDLKLRVGDEVGFDVQGVRLNARIAAVRKVDWKRLQPNFFFVFAPGALEGAPGFHIFTTRVNSAESSAKLQRRLATEFPNVSVVDLNLLLQTLDSILSKVSFVIHFMGLFTVFAGFLVLAGALLTGRFQRIREVVLLRTLGASRKQIREIIFVEYAMLGFMAALSGVILAEAASAGLCIYLFKTSYLPAVLPAVIGLFSVAGLTVVIGMFTNRGLLSQPPLQVLRSGLAD